MDVRNAACNASCNALPPAGAFAVLMGIQGQVTRTGWDGKTWGENQRISVDDALRVATINGAYATHEERIKGSISEGSHIVSRRTFRPANAAALSIMRIITFITQSNVWIAELSH